MSYKGLSKLKKKHLKVKHQKAKVFRASEPLLSVFMWGINHTINELTHVNIPVMLMPDDFKAFTRIRVDNHLYNKENMPSHFKFKEYCPLVFRNLRERFCISDSDYLTSLTKCQPEPGESSGRSGTRFYSSYDNFLTLKTLASEEVEQMHSFLKSYHPYVVERHGKTLLPQYLGMYRITVEATETYVVVIRNIFSAPIPIHKKYELKGSTVDREASEKQREKQLPTLKDNDFVKDAINIKLSSEAKQNFLTMLETDTQFLAGMNLIDYALSIGIHDCDKYEQELAEYATTANVGSDEDDGESSGGGCQGPLPPISGQASSSGKADYSYVPTPPDSPRLQHKNSNESETEPSNKGPIDSKRDIYAIESNPEIDANEIYFMGLVDILTQYGLRKRTAQAAKSVKHGTASEILTVHPDQYGKRLCDFICKSIV